MKFIYNSLALLIAIICLNTLTFGEAGGLTESRDILILNSYSDQYEWTITITEGIRDTLTKSSMPLKVRSEYMDTKNILSDEYFEQVFELYKLKYENQAFDAILCTDDNALRFLLEYRDRLFPDVPIFFCGLHSLDPYENEDLTSVYGVMEENSFNETMAVIRRQNPELQHVYLIIEASTSGESTRKDIEQKISKLDKTIKFTFIEGDSLIDIKKQVKNITDKNTVILFTFYVVDNLGTVYESQGHTTQQIAQVSNVPLYGLWAFSSGHGIAGGKLVSGYSQGEKATTLMLEYLENDGHVKKRFVSGGEANLHIYDYNILEKYNLDETLLPAESIVFNRPISFYEKHKRVLIVSMAIVFALVIYVVILRLQVYRATNKILETEKNLMQVEKMNALTLLSNKVAHEMNTPLGNCVTLVSYMTMIYNRIIDLLDSGKASSKDLIENLSLINDSFDSLDKNLKTATTQIESFKKISIQQNSTISRKFILKETINEAIQEAKKEHMNRTFKIEFDCPDDIEIKSRPGYYYQMLFQLISNSIEHGFREMDTGTIKIKVTTSQGHVHIKYADNGEAPTNICERIFEPFFSDTWNSEHSGLGMYTVFNIVHAENGIIQCSKSTHQGLSFTIKIPNKH
jgi:signal transduction histidine kinase